MKDSASLKKSCETALITPVNGLKWSKAPKESARVVIIGQAKASLAMLKASLEPWQIEQIKNSTEPRLKLSTEDGSFWILRPYFLKGWNSPEQRALLEESDYSITRDLVGEWWKSEGALFDLEIEFVATSSSQRMGAFVGIGLGHYRYLNCFEKMSLTQIYLKNKKSSAIKKDWEQACAIIGGVNLARHLVNLPPQDLNPKNYSEIVKKWFSPSSQVKVDVWNTARLKKEKMNLIVGVGQGAEHGPCMIHLRYRPRGGAKKKPLAFVGKGITFDTGGLDLKPSAGMRLMKKDMGGSAAVFSLAHIVSQLKLKQPCDFYLAVAENAVSDKSYHPSDVVTSKQGLSVEIDNTDAEGRLVLADVLNVAATQKGAHEPQSIINVATLTGAMNVALGQNLGGLFSNKDQLAKKIEASGQKWGDPVWRMPLFQPYRKELKSPFADMKNCGPRFGGAITAALFLESFVEKKNWAHLDIISWQKGSGPFAEEGGSGQAVQSLLGLFI